MGRGRTFEDAISLDYTPPRKVFATYTNYCDSAKVAEMQHQQVTSAVTRVPVGQAQLDHCKLPQSKVTHDKTEYMARSSARALCTHPMGAVSPNYSTVKAGEGLHVSTFLISSKL